MKRIIVGILIAGMLLATTVPTLAEQDNKQKIYIVGESTAQTYNQSTDFPQYGWGQVFGDCFTDDVVVKNCAANGMSTKRFDNIGRLAKVLEELKVGDFLFIQFGINDDARNSTEKYTPVDEYKSILTERYIGEAKNEAQHLYL